MYFHPKFIRGDPDGLSQLRKRINVNSKMKRAPNSFHPQNTCSAGWSSVQKPSIRTITPAFFAQDQDVFSFSIKSIHQAETLMEYNIQTLHNSSLPLSKTNSIIKISYPKISSVTTPFSISKSRDKKSFTQSSRIVTPHVKCLNMMKSTQNAQVHQPQVSSNSKLNSGRLALLAEDMKGIEGGGEISNKWK